jgi:hypothetical protein
MAEFGLCARTAIVATKYAHFCNVNLSFKKHIQSNHEHLRHHLEHHFYPPKVLHVIFFAQVFLDFFKFQI